MVVLIKKLEVISLNYFNFKLNYLFFKPITLFNILEDFDLVDFDIGDFDIGDFDLGDFGIEYYALGDFNLGDFHWTPAIGSESTTLDKNVSSKVYSTCPDEHLEREIFLKFRTFIYFFRILSEKLSTGVRNSFLPSHIISTFQQ